MDLNDDGVLDVELLGDEGSEDESEAPPSSEFYPGPGSTPTSCASSPRGEEPASPHGSVSQPAFFHQQPYVRPFFTGGRGRGRPRKDGPKLAKEGKIVRRYRGGIAGSVRGAKRHRTSKDEDDGLDDDDFPMPAPSEEPPYMPEKWPGKVCALCNLSERSQLGQGEMRQILCNIEGDGTSTPNVPSGGATPTNAPTPTSTPTTPVPPGLASPPPELVDPNQHPLALPLSTRKKAFNKCKTPAYNLEHIDELSIIGHVDPLELPSVVSSGAFYVHRCCLEFSPPFQSEVAAAATSDDDKELLEETRIRGIVTAALSRKCAFCNRHGASIPCKMSCSKYFHLACVLGSGGFMDFQGRHSFCKDHLYQVAVVCTIDVDCRACRTIGDIANLMTCSTCGAHYHGTCVGLPQLPGVRAGWACRSCRVCQVCRADTAPGIPQAESRNVTCEHCDKMYHATCLRPMMATVPKYGWKCKCCRVCSDCGARSPGAGPSSRWHAHYTVCDSCYQQRNKGSCCPLCRRAYRAAAYRAMIRCIQCKRYVHGTCDPDADPVQYNERKAQDRSYEYSCPLCKSQMSLQVPKTSSFDEDTMASTSQESSFGDENSLQDQDPLAIEQPKPPDVGLGKGKPYNVAAKVAKTKIGGYKLKGGFPPAGMVGFQKRQRSALDFGRKRGTKPKMRGVFGVPGLGLQRPQAPDNKSSEDDPAMENKLILVSSKDKFVLTQDLCVMCGAVGTDSEGCLIACAQCGQSYHPYCVNIKVTQVIVQQGWRCLDCTVCEGCGNKSDEPLLVLCDDCDTAWHTYCARPQLSEVPRGSWRCERCRRCLTCGTRDTDVWCDNYTECGPCASLVMCCVCSEPYSDGELIIQCEACRRWLHASCDAIRNEGDAETCCQKGYNCCLCRGRDVPPPHLMRAIEAPPPPKPAPRPAPTPQSLGLAGEYYVDDVCLSQRGAHHVKQLEAEMGITHTRRKRRFKNENSEKDAVVQNTDIEIGDDAKPDSTNEVKDEPGVSTNPNVKEGILWNVANDGPPPEGFTIYTHDSGLTVLRRKRQRNLNKLGIGGFVVRQRQSTLKAQADDDKDGDTMQSGESPGNKRKPRRKPRSKLMEQFPPYMQEAFFGKDLLEPSKPAVSSTGNPLESPGGSSSIRPPTPEGYRELRDWKVDENSDSDGEDVMIVFSSFADNDPSAVITLDPEEMEILNSLKPKEEKHDPDFDVSRIKTELEDTHLKHTEDSTALKNAIMGPQPNELEQPPTIATGTMPNVHSTKTEPVGTDSGGQNQASGMSAKDELSLLGVNLDAMVRDTLPDMDSNDVDEIFKGVLTDDSQESQESSVSYANSMAGTPYSQRQQLQSPMEYASPYHHTEFGGSGNSSLSPGFADCGPSSNASGWSDQAPAPPPSYNQRSADKMRADESLGSAATISAVLYANTNHPEWKTEFPNWVDRCKQILKKWRALPSDQKAPYLQRARDNRSAIRMKKAQQSSSEGESCVPAAAVAVPVAAAPAVVTTGVTSVTGVTGTVRAPNVTVTTRGLPEAEPHIRVLTPSEIMRTLPRLAHAPTEQERTCNQQRSAREAEQERQWKQLQQMRQQQNQQQQQIIHDQRIQDYVITPGAGVEERKMAPLAQNKVPLLNYAMQRLRNPDGTETTMPVAGPATPVGEAPKAAFPGQRFPLHYASSEDITDRQLRDLLQRHPEKMWNQQQSSEEGNVQGVSMDGQPFRQPLPVGVRPRPPLQSGQRPDHHMLIQQRLISAEVLQQAMEQKLMANNDNAGAPGGEPKQEEDHGNDEMDMGEMDKLESDTANIGEVGDILTGLGTEDDEELLESLTAEITGEQFNILEFADPELAALNDAEHILDGLELADDGMPERHAKREPPEEGEQKPDNKSDAELQKAVKNIENTKSEVKLESQDDKPEGQEIKHEVHPAPAPVRQMLSTGLQRVLTPSQQAAIQNAMQALKAEVKLDGEQRAEGWQQRLMQQRSVFGQVITGQTQQTQIQTQSGLIQRTQYVVGAGGTVVQRPHSQFASHHVHFAQGSGGQASGIHSQVMAGSVQTTIQRPLVATERPLGTVGVGRAPPPPPYPGTLRASAPHQPPPPYPQAYEADLWPDWLHRRPLLLQEQPLLLEELLEQEKREQESGGEWAAPPPAIPSAAPPPAPRVPLYVGVAPPAQPPPPERIATEADHRARLVYEQWLKQFNAFATDQLRYYETEVQKLRKMRKSLNSKQRQLRKAGNELQPNDAAELQRVATEQQALQKHLDAARKQARQHSVLIQEYETKQRQQNPQLVPQTVISQQQMQTNQTVFAQSQNMGQQQMQQQTITRPLQIGQQGIVQQQQIIRTQQVVGPDGQIQQQRIGLVTSPIGSQGRIIQQGGRTLVIEQSNTAQAQLVRQLSNVQERPQSVGGMMQFQQQHMMQSGIRQALPQGSQTPRTTGPRPAMSPLHVQSPHSQSPQFAPQSPLPPHHLSSPMQSPLHSQQSPLHHTAQSPLHPSTQSPLHTQQSPLHHSQQSPMHVQTNLPQQSPMHPQQSPMHPQQSPMHQSPITQSPLHQQHPQQSPMHSQQSSMHSQQSPMHTQQSSLQSSMHSQQSPMHSQQSSMHSQQSPMHSQQSPMHSQQSPMQSPMQSSISPQHFLQQLQAQRTSPQLPTPSRSPQIYQQTQIQSPVASHSPQLLNSDFITGRFSRPAPGGSPMQTRFARPPHHQQGMRVGVPFGSRQQTSPLGSPQPMPSPGNPGNELARQQMLQRQQYSPMGGAPPSPLIRPGTPSASPAASPAPSQDHGGGHQHHMAPIPPGYRYFKVGLFGGAPVWPNKDDRRPHINKVSILKRRPQQRFAGKTAAPTDERPTEESQSSSDSRDYVLFAPDEVEYGTVEDAARMNYSKDNDDEEDEDDDEDDDDDDDDDVEEIEHLDDADIVVVEPGAISPVEERIATEEDFEELIDSRKPEEETEEEVAPQERTTRTETKTVAVISLATAKQSSSNVQQFKLVNPSQSSTISRLPVLSATVLSPHPSSKILNEVSQATVASVSIANQTISVPVLKSLSLGHGASLHKPQLKKMPLNITQSITTDMSSQHQSKPGSVISVISSNMSKSSNANPVITLATSSTTAGPSRVPVSILSQHQVTHHQVTQHQIKQKIVKTIEKPMGLSLSNTKLSSLSVTHDATLPAKIFQDEAASPDSTVLSESTEKDNIGAATTSHLSLHSEQKCTKENKDIDIESEISKQTELPHTLCITDRTPLLLGKSEIKSPDPIPEKIPDNIMEGDDDDKEDNIQSDILLNYAKDNESKPENSEESVVKTIKAIANQTKEMVIDSNMQISSEITQESVQISIPSPTPSQEKYLNDITMQEHGHAVEGPNKPVDIEDMLCIFDNIPDHMKHSSSAAAVSKKLNNAQIRQEIKDTKDTKEQVSTIKREPERLGLQSQSAAVPQLSPLSQPAELTSNMANVSQQLRSFMSSLNTNAQKVEAHQIVRQTSEPTTPTQVNFENLLPSSKVEVPIPKASPVQRIEKPISTITTSDVPISASQVIGSRVNTLSNIGQPRKSPTVSPASSPATLQNPMMKAPAQVPLIHQSQQLSKNEEITASSSSSQIIQMPTLSKIQSQPAMVLTSNTVTTSGTGIQKGQILSSSILGHTLLQPTRQINTGVPYNSQNISTSQPPALVMTSRPLIGNNNPVPNVTVRTQAMINPAIGQMQHRSQTGPVTFVNSSKLLHSQLTSPLKRSKSTDEPKTEVVVGHIQPAKRHSVESVIVKSEPMETDEPNSSPTNSDFTKTLIQPGSNQRNDESQNVLLKQLLQTSAASTNVVPQRTVTIQRTAPALGTIPSLEAQLARPSIPPPTLALTQEMDIAKSTARITTVSSPFTTRPLQTQTTVPMSSMSPLIQTPTHHSALIDIRKPTAKIMAKEETTSLPESSPTIKSVQPIQMYSINVDHNQQLQMPIKKEVAPPQQSPVHRPYTPMDVKKELLDESSQQSATSGVSNASDPCKLDQPIKEEYSEGMAMDVNPEIMTAETALEAKKRKRREYQQKKRKQMQMNMKAAAENNMTPTNAKKRPRKGSRYEEDYDTFIDNLIAQLRLLPPMQIQEPTLTTNFSVCPLFGSGDLTKLKNKDYDIIKGDLLGEFGNAKIPNVADYYNTKPFGDEEPLPEKPTASTQRGFYDQEFQPIVFDEDPEDKKLDFVCRERDTDTPDSILSCSSPECLEIEPPNRFPGLKLIDDEENDDDTDSVSGRVSPIIPILTPVPVRLKPVMALTNDDDDTQKVVKTETDLPGKPNVDCPEGTESNENVTVTLTLTSGAAEDILGVLKELAGILHIPPPTSYQIVERTATPPSHKLGLYRSKGKDGKEGTPIDIQSILNGAAKFCRHCDVVILDSVVRAKASEFPLLSANKGNAEEILCDSDTDLFFCGKQCYERFAWRPTNIILDGKSRIAIKEDSKSDIDLNLSKDRDDFDTASTESMETDDLDIKTEIKDEKMDLSFMDGLDNDELMKEVGDDVSALDEDLKSEDQDEKSNQSMEKEKFKGVRYKAWAPGCIGPPVKYKRPTDRELTELVFRTGVTIMPVTNEDNRRCELCGIQGDGVADGVSRLLNCDVNRWVHLNCALWSEGVYETVSGALMNVETALANGSNTTCAVCKRLGATVRCFKTRCGSVYHVGCAVKESCVFYKNKTAFCQSHAPKGEKDNELTTLSVQRRVFVSRDEQRQLASVMLHSDTNHLIRVGSLIFLSPGHLLPHQLAAFHTPNYIYPIGYKIVRFYWSMTRANCRCRYLCWISEEDGKPKFHVRVQDDPHTEMAAGTPRAAWAQVLDAVAALREARNEDAILKLWPNYVTGEDLFGLTEPTVVRVLESLPGIETLTDYRFKFGRSALLEGGLAVNPSGCARCEPRARTHWKRPPRSILPTSAPPVPTANTSEGPACPYSKQFVHTKSSQYKKMKMEWRNNVYLARSKIAGLGLYAARDIEKHTMVIEYIGEIIRSELSEIREKKYEAKNRGIYMFRLDERRVVDATLSGGLARYINHSCQPNCVAETVEVDRDLRIIIFAKRRIARGEELAYDYKFDIEDDAHKISCMCGAPNCRKWMN